MHRLDLRARERFDEGRPAIHLLAESAHARILLVCLRPGQALPDHKSASQVIAQVIRGKVVFTADGSSVEEGAGCIILLEPDRFHRIAAVDESVILVTMAPHPSKSGWPPEQADRIVLHGVAPD